MKSSRLNYFIERLLSLRAAASSIYDRGMVAGKKVEEVAQEIEPLTKALSVLIQANAQDNLPGCVMAIQRLETMAQGLEADANFLLQKAENNRAHADEIKTALALHMKKLGVSELKDGDFTAVLASQGDIPPALILR